MPPSIPLVCPACRSGRLHGPLDSRFVCAAEACRATYPVIDGIPILVPNWVDYAQSERWIILRRGDLTPDIDFLLDEPLGDDHAEKIRARHLETYTRSHFGAPNPELGEMDRVLAQWVGAHLEKGRSGLDAGCATGGFTALLAEKVEAALGIDLHFERVREAHRRVSSAAFAVASAEDPPVERGSLDVLLALNLIDAIGHPRIAMHNLLECLRPGGLLLLTTPFEYSTVYSPKAEWVDEAELAATLASQFEILDDRPRLPWVLPVSDRHSDVFFVRAIAARKR